MKVAILEVCIPTHYNITNALIKIYSTDPFNSITVFTLEPIAKALSENGVPENVSVIVFKEGENASTFFKNIEKNTFDRLHICTLEAHYQEFASFKPNVKETIFHLHDIDIWFENTFASDFKNLLYNLKNSTTKLRDIARFGRDILIRKPARQRFLANLQNREHYYLVHSMGQKNYLSRFVSSRNVLIFPSDVFESTVNDKHGTPSVHKIRICIPGIVTNSRRDYDGLFDILESILPQIKNKLVFDFLGFIEKSEPHLLQRLQNLEKQGLELHYYKDFVAADTFDENLEKADILLNNQKVVASFTSKYGVTKESGFLFKMIRGAKPGIIPSDYIVDDEFKEALLYFNSNEKLANVLIDLANGSIDLEYFKSKALEIAHNHTPKNLYERIKNLDVLV